MTEVTETVETPEVPRITIDVNQFQAIIDQVVEQVLADTRDNAGLNLLFEDVFSFHKAFNHPANQLPTLQPLERAAKRADWIKEELDELVAARTIVDQADAYIDTIYFAVGGLVELGVKPQALWNIVQNANMAKLGPDGKPLFHPDGKTKKPEGWVAPEPLLAAEVERQLQESTN